MTRTSATAPSCSARRTRSSQHRAESASQREARGSSRKRMRGWRLCSTSWMYWGKTGSIGSCQQLPEHSGDIFQPKLHLPHPAQPLGAPHSGHSMSVPFLKAGKSLPGVGAGIWQREGHREQLLHPRGSSGKHPTALPYRREGLGQAPTVTLGSPIPWERRTKDRSRPSTWDRWLHRNTSGTSGCKQGILG